MSSAAADGQARRPATGGNPPRSESENEPAPADPTAEHYALHLRETAGAMFVYTSIGDYFKDLGPEAYQIYRRDLLADAGNPTDPIEVMMIEQVALAHFNIGRLHFKTATADHPEITKTYGSLAIALTGEFRRTALALQKYRESAQTTNVPPVSAPDPGGGDSELGSKTRKNDGEIIPFRDEESPPGRGRPAERPAAQGPDQSRSRPAPRRCLGS